MRFAHHTANDVHRPQMPVPPVVDKEGRGELGRGGIKGVKASETAINFRSRALFGERLLRAEPVSFVFKGKVFKYAK